MKKSEAKTGIFSRGLTAKQPNAAPQPVNGIFVRMYSDVNCPQDDLIMQDFGNTFDAEQLCYMAVEKLELTPLVAPLFALAQPSLESWCPPNEKIDCSEDCAREFVLRVRFIPPLSVITKLSHTNSKMFNYLFQQIRSDFINDRIGYQDKSIGQEYLLGLGVVDMVRYGKQHGINLTELRSLGPQNFIPAGAKNKFRNLLDKQRLKMNFKPHLEDQYKQYESDSVVNVQLTYVKGITEYAEHYGMETFRIESTYSRSEPTIVQVKPYDSEFPGLNIYKGKVVQTVLRFYLLQLLCIIVCSRINMDELVLSIVSD